MIRLLDAKKIVTSNDYRHPTKEERKRQQTTPYIILSHMWMGDEVEYENMENFGKIRASPFYDQSESAAKIVGACQKVLAYDKGKVKHLWMDTVCINKQDAAELSASINSMYRWYKGAEACFAYLRDFPTEKVQVFTQSRWFDRGWTLQELVAPKKVIFYDKHWKEIGSKSALYKQLEKRTKINSSTLLEPAAVNHASISERMSWYVGREVRVPEDTAYCLLGLFGVNMPLLYGEGQERAFQRLQEEIMRYSDDHSLFAWKSTNGQAKATGLLAASPEWFHATGQYSHRQDLGNQNPYQMTNKGISISLRLFQYQGLYVASIDCPDGEDAFLGVYLKRISPSIEQYERIRTDQLCSVRKTDRGNTHAIFVKGSSDI